MRVTVPVTALPPTVRSSSAKAGAAMNRIRQAGTSFSMVRASKVFGGYRTDHSVEHIMKRGEAEDAEQDQDLRNTNLLFFAAASAFSAFPPASKTGCDHEVRGHSPDLVSRGAD